MGFGMGLGGSERGTLTHDIIHCIIEQIHLRLTFIYLRGFASDERRLGLTDDDRREIENVVMDNPAVGSVIPGANGLRKFRFAPGRHGGGKSGGIRVCYFLLVQDDACYFVSAFAKNEKANLSKAERNTAASLIREVQQLVTRSKR